MDLFPNQGLLAFPNCQMAFLEEAEIGLHGTVKSFSYLAIGGTKGVACVSMINARKTEFNRFISFYSQHKIEDNQVFHDDSRLKIFHFLYHIFDITCTDNINR